MVIDKLKVTNSIKYWSKTARKGIYPAYACTFILDNILKNITAVILWLSILNTILIPYVIKQSPNIN